MNRDEWEQNSYLAGLNAPYVEALYDAFLEDPAQVPEKWQAYFKGVADGKADMSHEAIRESLRERAKHWRKIGGAVATEGTAGIEALKQAYRRYGHYSAHINPLDAAAPALDPHLEPSRYGVDTQSDSATIDAFHKIYCGSIGYEFAYIDDDEQRQWLESQVETVMPSMQFSADEKQRFLSQLIAADGLEKYLDVKYPGQKRFSIEGNDSLVPLLRELTFLAGQSTLKELVLAMAHRGRLNVLLNVMGRKSKDLFDEFDGAHEIDQTSGDVKYHRGYSSDVKTPIGEVHLSLKFNPSHLEFIGPVAMGSTRARQDNHGCDKNYAMPIVMHGDAAFIGQGVVMESFSMSQTPAYSVGGTVHVVTNNQVGFTTSDPHDARSSRYCSDAAKMISAPVFHVNADDVEAVIKVTRLAFAYRMQFHRDVIIDLVGYRRHGHQEVDEPRATQPGMYSVIKARPVAAKLYAEQLVQQGVIEATTYDSLRHAYRDILDAGKETIEAHHEGIESHNSKVWEPHLGIDWREPGDTTVSLETLKSLGEKLTAIPDSFTLHRNVKNIVDTRRKMTAGEQLIDWGYGEMMAYASLLAQGHDVRLTGEDVRRGTFYHRHARHVDQLTNEDVIPLASVADEHHCLFSIHDSILSETATMAFEYGYAVADPTGLVIWEAQFGDFANVAQVIIDQFLSSAWQKWKRLSGLVLLLPHGYEGMGPEHSSARLERYLQLCAQENMQVCVPTTPAQIFHLLRRQVIRPLRRPLVVMTPKSLLRHKMAVSTLEDLSEGGFQAVIPESEELDATVITRVIACSGKVYYELLEKRRELGRQDVAIIRVEQLYPFPYEEIEAILGRYPNLKELVWCQEEPKNQGAWFWVRDRFAKHLQGISLNYAGRSASAAPACGYPALHKQQQADLLECAFADAFKSKNVIQF